MLLFDQNSQSAIISLKDVSYMKQVAISMNRIAVWPLNDSKNKKYSFSIKQNVACILYMGTLFVLQMWYVRNNISTISFFKMGRTYITLAMSIVCLQRLTMPWIKVYREVAKEFLEKNHLFYQKDRSDYAMKIYNQVQKICHLFTMFVHVQLYGGVILFNVTPWHQNFKAGMFSSSKPINGTFEIACYLQLPFDYLTDFNGYIFVSILGWVAICIGSSAFCLCHLFLSLIVFHIWGNLKILRHSLENFPKPTNQLMTIADKEFWYTNEESELVSKLIIEMVNHHRMIMKFMSKTSEAYSFFLLLNYVFYQIVGCIVLLECSKLSSEALANYGPLTVALFQQLIQISVFFELIGSENEKLIDTVYSLPWECMELRNRKLVLFFLQNVQQPTGLKACGMVNVGVQTMAAILKTCCSYFIMLRTLATEGIL